MKRLRLEDVADLIFSFRPDDAFTKEEVIAQMHGWNAVVRQVKRGETVIRAGTPATHFLMLLDGFLTRILPCPLGDDIVVGAVRPGEFTGVSAVFAPSNTNSTSSLDLLHPIDVIAATDAIVVLFDVNRLRAKRNDPKLAPLFDLMTGILCRLLYDARQNAFILNGKTVAERLRRYLAIHTLHSTSTPTSLTIPGTELDLARHLGVNKCALSRTIGQLRKQGKITYKRNVITVLK